MRFSGSFELLKLTFALTAILLSLLPGLATLEDAAHWDKVGREQIEESLKIDHNHRIAKNVILFVGDGMGLTTITASRIFKGQLEGAPGEEGYLAFEKFPNVGLLKTYNVDRQIPDSAGTATALFSGVKANYYTIGFDASVTFNTCRSDVEAKAKLTSLIDWGIEANKSTGIVTNTRITHATPAATYAHSTHRDWECDSGIPETERDCKDIARQLVEDEPGRNINVVLGGGEQVLRAQINSSSACKRGDGKDLVWEWMQYQKNLGRTNRYISNRHQLLDVDNSVDYLLGLFAPNHIPYDKDRDQSLTGQPSLEEMTAKAIQILSRNTNGYVLIVEGGRIDHAHHDNLALIALEEAVALNKAVEKALAMTDSGETLIVVTADHSHSMAMNGYPARGNPIEGLADATPEGFVYETLSYTNGPGYPFHRLKMNEEKNRSTSTLDTWINLNDTKHQHRVSLNASAMKHEHKNGNNASGDGSSDARKFPHLAGFWMDWETHGGEDVPVYSLGPMAHLLHGVHEQSHVAYVISYSTCIGPYLKKCRETNPNPPPSNNVHHGTHSSSTGQHNSMLLSVAILLFVQILCIQLNY